MSSEVRDETFLLARARQGDLSAFEEIVGRYQRRVYGVALRIVRSHAVADDVAQEAFLKAWQALDRFELGRPFGPWVCRIAANLAVNHVRSPVAREDPLPEGHGETRAAGRGSPRRGPRRRGAAASRRGPRGAAPRPAGGLRSARGGGDVVPRDRRGPRPESGHGDEPPLPGPGEAGPGPGPVPGPGGAATLGRTLMSAHERERLAAWIDGELPAGRAARRSRPTSPGARSARRSSPTWRRSTGWPGSFPWRLRPGTSRPSRLGCDPGSRRRRGRRRRGGPGRRRPPSWTWAAAAALLLGRRHAADPRPPGSRRGPETALRVGAPVDGPAGRPPRRPRRRRSRTRRW